LVLAEARESFLDIKHLYIKVIQGSDMAGKSTESKQQDTRKQDIRGIHLWLVLWKAAKTLGAYADRSIGSLDMCRSDFGVLEALLHKGPLPIKTLGEKVLLTSGSITTAIDRLEEHGWVERQMYGDDRRSRIVRLTASGREVIRTAFAGHTKHMEEAVSGLKPAERVVLIDLLRRLGQDAENRLHADKDLQKAAKKRK
jgi:MarR family 2-MHQ and catechol resistance regulon transcriptional repressor